VERSGFQLSLVQHARTEGLPVRELAPDKDKVSRAMPATAALEGGRVLLPVAAQWVRDLVDEALAFPVGRHDDQVDVLAYGVEVARAHYARPRIDYSDLRDNPRPPTVLDEMTPNPPDELRRRSWSDGRSRGLVP
jgi:hypothetical protein